MIHCHFNTSLSNNDNCTFPDGFDWGLAPNYALTVES